MPPTLMIKGKLAPPDGDPATARELAEWIPLDYIIEWFSSRAQKTGMASRVLVLKSETASGKSTALPPAIFRRLVMRAGARAPGLIVTQPRVLTAIENVSEMMKYHSDVFRLGENIGWSTKYNKRKPRTFGLLSATIGTLAQQLRVMSDEEIKAQYRYILIDETHERDLQTDITLYMLKNFLLRNVDSVDCPFVVTMSATFEPDSFLKYFGVPAKTNFVWCVGASAGITEMWDWNQGRIVNDYTRAAAQVVEKIVAENPDDPVDRGDILIFMPGAQEFKQTENWLRKLNSKLAHDRKPVFSIVKVDSEAVRTQNAHYKRLTIIPVTEHTVTIDGQAYSPSRRVVISTNVAETGLTLSNLKYVIDGGYNREMEYDPVYGIRSLLTKPAPQSRVRQRRGRAGRNFPGVFYPLYPRYIYDRLPVLQLPQILCDNIAPAMLDIIVEQLRTKKLSGVAAPEFRAEDIDMIDIPSKDALHECIETLYALGYLSSNAPQWDPDVHSMTDHAGAFSLTQLGAVATSFSSLTPENSRMILAAYSWGCSIVDMITIAAYISVGSGTFNRARVEGDVSRPTVKWEVVYKAGLPGYITSDNLVNKVHILLGDEFINGLVLFNAVKYTIANVEPQNLISVIRRWCETTDISYKAILDFIRARDDLIEQMLGNGMNVFAQESEALSAATAKTLIDTVTKIKYCIYDGYRMNLMTRVDGKYRTRAGLEVATPGLFYMKIPASKEQQSFIPNALLYRGLTIRTMRDAKVGTVVANDVCMLDGFVNYDPDFLL